jgi:hypothetical protein
MFVCRSHLVECGGEGLIACSFCLRVCCVVHLYCPCDRAAARRSYVIINDAMMAAARASESARKAKMAADRAGTAARSMELAGFGGLVFGLGPFTAPTINSRVGVPVLGLSGPTVAPRHKIILFYLVLSPPAFMPQPLGLFRLLSLALLRPLLVLFPYLLRWVPALLRPP